MTDSPAKLISEILALDDWCDAQSAKFSEYLKPHKEKVEALKMQLHEQLLKLNEAKQGEHPRASISTMFDMHLSLMSGRMVPIGPVRST